MQCACASDRTPHLLLQMLLVQGCVSQVPIPHMDLLQPDACWTIAESPLCFLGRQLLPLAGPEVEGSCPFPLSNLGPRGNFSIIDQSSIFQSTWQRLLKVNRSNLRFVRSSASTFTSRGLQRSKHQAT